MLRIVHVIGQMPGHGTQRQLAGMLRSAHRRHWSAVLAVLRSGDPLSQDVSQSGIPVVEFSGADRDPRRMMALRTLLRDADVVHSSLWGASVFTRVAAATSSRRPAVVVSERSVEVFRSSLRRRIDRLLSRWTEEYIANSKDVANFVASAHGIELDRITIIKNGIDTTTFFPAQTPQSRGTAKLGVVGRLVHEKGLDVLLSALPSVVASPPVELTIVGEGPERVALERKAQDLPVKFAGYFPDHSEVASFLRSIDVFVMPSRWEGLPNALLEALACGIPVVATNVPGMAEAAEGNAELVPPDQPAALADAISRALVSRVRPTVRTNSFENVAQAHLEVFERAHARRHRRPFTTSPQNVN